MDQLESPQYPCILAGRPDAAENLHVDNAVVISACVRAISEALLRSPIPALRFLLVELVGDALALRGQLSSYYLKQLAQEAVRPLLNGRQLFNHVVVCRSLDAPAQRLADQDEERCPGTCPTFA